jgi:putative RecB family exonuclease
MNSQTANLAINAARMYVGMALSWTTKNSILGDRAIGDYLRRMTTGSKRQDTSTTNKDQSNSSSEGDPDDVKPREPNLKPESQENGPWRPTRLSHSSISTYMSCPKKWYFSYVEKREREQTPATLVGGLVHQILEQIYQLPAEERTLDLAKYLSKELWPSLEEDEYFAKHGMTEDQRLEYKHLVWDNVAGIFEMEDPSQVEVYAVEQELYVHFGDLPIIGFVDRMDVKGDTVDIVDYKSGSPGAERYRPKKLKQVQLYAAMAREQLGLKPGRVRLLFPAHNESIEADATDKSMTKIVKEVTGVWSDIKSSIDKDEYPASVGPLCAWCDFVNECPKGEEEVRMRHKGGNVRLDSPGVRILGLT